MLMNSLSTDIITFKHSTRDIQYEWKTSHIEKQAYMDMDQIKEHDNGSYAHGNISHQQKY